MSGYSNAVLALSPVAYWRLGETSGTVAADAAGSHHGVYTGTCTLGADSLLVSDTGNKSLSLARSGYVAAGAQSNLNTAAFTILGWIKLSSIAADNFVFVNYTTPEAGPYNGSALVVRSTGKIELYTSFTSVSNSLNRTYSSGTLAINTAYFIAATFTGGNTALYINGVIDTAQTGKQTPVYTSCQVNIGGISNAAGYSGLLDEIAFFNRALTAAEIAHLYARALASYSVSGIITDRFGTPCQRKVYAMSRPTDTTAPQIISHGLSDPTTGAYEIFMPSSEEITRVVVSEDDNPLLNDIVDRVIPA